MRKITIVFILVLYFNNIFSQSTKIKISNIHYRIINNKIEIFYLLYNNYDSVKVDVIFYKRSMVNFEYYLIFISGDVGKGKFSGINKKITWYYKKEPAYLFTGSGFYFKVIAAKILQSNQ